MRTTACGWEIDETLARVDFDGMSADVLRHAAFEIGVDRLVSLEPSTTRRMVFHAAASRARSRDTERFPCSIEQLFSTSTHRSRVALTANMGVARLLARRGAG